MRFHLPIALSQLELCCVANVQLHEFHGLIVDLENFTLSL